MMLGLKAYLMMGAGAAVLMIGGFVVWQIRENAVLSYNYEQLKIQYEARVELQKKLDKQRGVANTIANNLREEREARRIASEKARERLKDFPDAPLSPFLRETIEIMKETR